tara:strand:+ start:130 stop:417 length:288 start_codon:yes stop_codon:yes gene_type:complete
LSERGGHHLFVYLDHLVLYFCGELEATGTDGNRTKEGRRGETANGGVNLHHKYIQNSIVHRTVRYTFAFFFLGLMLGNLRDSMLGSTIDCGEKGK